MTKGLTATRLRAVLLASVVVVLMLGAASAYAVGRWHPQAAEPGTLGRTTDVSAPGTVISTLPSNDAVDATHTGPARTPPSAGTGDALVAVDLSPSAQGSPYARNVRDTLSRYFTAINRHDYDAWLTTVTTAQAKRDRGDWEADYATTTDSGIYVSDIDPAAEIDPDAAASLPEGSLAVRIQFVSHQSVALAPTALPRDCVRWDVTYFIVDEGPGLRVGNSLKSPAMAECQ